MSLIKRKHFFEFEDFKWLPKSLRATITDVLWFYLTKFRIYDPIIPVLAGTLRACQMSRIVDLCSGSGGAVLRIKDGLEKFHGISTDVTLTDLFPNPEAAVRIANSQNPTLRYRETSFDVLNSTEKTESFRTMFTAFHHFKPEQAEKILQNAVAASEPIAIFEFTKRSFDGFIQMLSGPPIMFLITPFIKPFNWKRIFWVYIFPIAPFVLFFDGVVSCFRTYSLDEMQGFTKKFPTFNWKIGRARQGLAEVSYLIGTPASANNVSSTE